MKKGFTLIELLVSLTIISIVIIFITAFVFDLKDEKSIVVNVPLLVDQVAISKELNNEAVKYGISNITLESNNKKAILKYKNGLIRTIEINTNTIKYSEGSNILFVKTLPDGINFTQIEYDSEDDEYHEIMDNTSVCISNEWTASGKECKFDYFGTESNSESIYNCMKTVTDRPSSCNKNTAGTYVYSCLKNCKKSAINGSCSEGSLSGSYCYLYNQTQCNSNLGWETVYQKYTYTCEEKFSFTDFSNTVNSDCSNEVVTLPETCNSSQDLGNYITACTPSNQQCTSVSDKKYFKYTIGLSNNENIEVYYYGD